MNTQSNQKMDITIGATVQGQWNKNKYVLMEKLGEGANGQVYLVKSKQRKLAMKIAYDPVDLQSEVNTLAALQKHQDPSYIFDVDDFSFQHKLYSFYVMPYFKGISITEYVNQNGSSWLYVIGAHILKQLVSIHNKGYVFGDLKMSNVIVDQHGKCQVIDYGGATEKGKAVKQFTDIYDRAYWGEGSRVADEHFDVFAMSMLMIQTMNPNGLEKAAKMLPQHRNIDMLRKIVLQAQSYDHLKPWVIKGITQSFTSSLEAKQYWHQLMKRTSSKAPISSLHGWWLYPAFISAILMFLTSVYYLLW
ncbi:protein kinase domain-containing protein [Longirhabdus pacifica]|uniref:protein kinase domain-containing protein n=1 Tax=Longirhabdus pacifica TaxID=2305227 RepID=UPI001008B6F1|nr:protein kinase [Longirhabdus pacifica]